MVRSTATLAAAALSLQSVAAVTDVGGAHACTTDGSTTKCWGYNKWGQLGRGDNVTIVGDDPDEMGDNLVDVDVGGTVSDLALGGEHSCALLDTGDVVCFGQNDKGQLGLGDKTNRGQTPDSIGEVVDFGSGLTAVAITTGCDHTCGLLDDGSVKCFGYNNYGQLGQGSTDSQGDDAGEMGDALLAVPLTGTVVAIDAGCDFTCALMEGGSVMCWGRNTWGQLGTGDSDDRLDGSGLALVAVDLDGSVANAIASGEGHVCAMLDDSSIKCWGRNNFGQLGQGDDVDRGQTADTLGSALLAVSLGSGKIPVEVDCGSFHTCVLIQEGDVKCFGSNSDGELGNGNFTDVGLLPTDMGDNLTSVSIDPAQEIAAGGSSTCAVLSDSEIICWGRGNDGQLGQGDDEDISNLSGVDPLDLGSDTLAPTPTPVKPSSSAYTAPPSLTAPSASPTFLTSDFPPSVAPSPATPQAATSSAAPTAPTATISIDASSSPTSSSREIDDVTQAPSPSSSNPDVDAEASGAPAHFSAHLVATVTVVAVGLVGTLFL